MGCYSVGLWVITCLIVDWITFVHLLLVVCYLCFDAEFVAFDLDC